MLWGKWALLTRDQVFLLANSTCLECGFVALFLFFSSCFTWSLWFWFLIFAPTVHPQCTRVGYFFLYKVFCYLSKKEKKICGLNFDKAKTKGIILPQKVKCNLVMLRNQFCTWNLTNIFLLCAACWNVRWECSTQDPSDYTNNISITLTSWKWGNHCVWFDLDLPSMN